MTSLALQCRRLSTRRRMNGAVTNSTFGHLKALCARTMLGAAPRAAFGASKWKTETVQPFRLRDGDKPTVSFRSVDSGDVVDPGGEIRYIAF